MSKPIKQLTLRGKVLLGNSTGGHTDRITLFDGRFDTGYRVTKFIVSTNNASGDADCIGKLSTEEPADPTDAFWDWSDNTQIAWAGFEMDAVVTPQAGWSNGNALVDRDNLIVEDLFITCRSRNITSPFVNYYIELEQYKISDWEGALVMVRNNSQNVE